jgi:hypothetical protein
MADQAEAGPHCLDRLRGPAAALACGYGGPTGDSGPVRQRQRPAAAAIGQSRSPVSSTERVGLRAAAWAGPVEFQEHAARQGSCVRQGSGGSVGPGSGARRRVKVLARAAQAVRHARPHLC